MTTRARVTALACVLALALPVAACSGGDDEPAAAPTSEPTTEAPPPGAGPAVQALAIAPASTERLSVTDLDELKLILGADELTGSSAEDERDAFWSAVQADTAALTEGVLRPDEEQLAADHGFGAEDLAWEAEFSGPDGDGWAGGFTDDVDLDAVQDAIDDGVGVLDGATLDPGTGVVSVGGAATPEESLAADDDVAVLVPDDPAVSVLVRSGCVPGDVAFTSGEAPDDLAGLADLGPFALYLGETLATARLGPDRPGLFDRTEIADADVDFAEVFADGVADPASGRIGYVIDDPRAAADRARSDQLAFAACAE